MNERAYFIRAFWAESAGKSSGAVHSRRMYSMENTMLATVSKIAKPFLTMSGRVKVLKKNATYRGYDEKQY